MAMIDLGPQGPVNTEAVPHTPMKALREWHAATEDVNISGSNRYIEERNQRARKVNVELRMALIREEFKEVMDELLDIVNGQGNRVKLAKELADLLYVVYGTGDDFDIPLEEVFRAVHASNMTKVGSNGRVERRNDGKILKGPNYTEPDIASIVLPGVSS
jgi:NTP pyrophosphatase (non-canonical NTP hydrolase)